MGDRLRVDVDGGKYTVIQPESGGAYVLRYGELWLDELPEGANCWLAMAYELEELRAKETHPYHIGPLTFDRVFRAGQLDNMADMQAVLDAVERALEAE